MLDTLTYLHFRATCGLVAPGAAPDYFDRETFQNLFVTLNRIDAPYDDFSYRAGHCTLSRGSDSQLESGAAYHAFSYRDGALSLSEESTGLQPRRFATRLISSLRAWFVHFPETLATDHTCCLRALVRPSSEPDASRFLADRVMCVGASLVQSLTSHPQGVGFRFNCEQRIDPVPATGPPSSAEQSNSTTIQMTVRINAWRDNRAIWIEVVGKNPADRSSGSVDAAKAASGFQACREFLEQKVIGEFLARYDAAARLDVERARDAFRGLR